MKIKITLDFPSVETVLNGSQQAAIYGWDFCEYEQIQDILSHSPRSPVKTVFTRNLGIPLTKYGITADQLTLEGRPIDQIEVDMMNPSEAASRIDKAGLTNIVFENYKRQLEGLPLIPVLFLVQSTRFPCFDTNPVLVTSKIPEYNEKRTHAEIRRAYKLTQMFGDVAEGTFKFIKMHVAGRSDCKMEQIPAPWDCPEWKKLWAERTQHSPSRPKSDDWRLQLCTKKRIHSLFKELTTLPKEYASSDLLFPSR